jgi:hypothetical protein
MAKRKHEYSSAGSNDPAPGVGLGALLENTGKGKPSAGVKAAHVQHSMKDIKATIRQSIRAARQNQRG